MIEQLLKYARDHDLAPEPGFTTKDVRWAVKFGPDGSYLGVVELGDAESKNNRGRKFARCPDLSQGELLTSVGCHFLIESAQHVCLLGVDKLKEKEQKSARAKHAFFVHLLSDAASAVPSLSGAATALASDTIVAAIANDLQLQRAKPGDKVTLELDGVFPVETTAWHDWWRAWRAKLAGSRSKSEQGGQMLSFATGLLVTPARTHPKIAGLGVVGAAATGAVLVGFDKQAFCSYGLDQSANGAMSEGDASAYRAALHHLFDHQSGTLAGALYAAWYSRPVPREWDVLVDIGLRAKDAAAPSAGEEAAGRAHVAKILSAIQAGGRPDLLGAEYFILSLAGVSGRVAIRAWQRGRLDDLVQAADRWFGALEIVSPVGSAPAPSPKLDALITCALPAKPGAQKYADWVRPLSGIRSALMDAAINPRVPIPFSALARVTVQNATFLRCDALGAGNRDDDRAALGFARSLWSRRAALMKAYHVRKGDSNMGVYMNPNHPSAAYHCGRMMAVFAALQRAAQGQVGADVIQRFYAAASSTPALTFGRLTRLSQFHLNKLNPGLAWWFQTRLAEIASAIGGILPVALTLEQQSLFALGYYQQMAFDRAQKPDGEFANIPSEGETND